ncbi:MAG: hypothetical protein JNK82_34520 [Myxococcaceae bacterium]|nr:hypothetical protein [Myxococcaceae bacterium]
MRFIELIAEGRRTWPNLDVADAAVARVLSRSGAPERPGPHPDDRYLAAACLVGSRRATAALVEGPLARALARVRPDLRSDVGQSVSERLLLGAEPALLQYEGTASLERWLSRVVENAATDVVRATRDLEPLSASLCAVLSSPEGRLVDDASRAPVQQIVRDVLTSLAPDDRRLLALFHHQRLPHAKIGAELGMPRSTVAFRLAKLHQRLAKLIRDRAKHELRLVTAEVDDALELLHCEWSRPLPLR